MNKFLFFSMLLLCSSYLHAQNPNSDGVLHVKKYAAGDGRDWANALGELADALKYASTNPSIKQIWVAGGTYLPKYTPETSQNFSETPADARDKAFLLVKDVKIYGGFAGTEDNLAQRDLSIGDNQSVLSGDIGNANLETDNAYHVVVGAGNAGTAELNGFVVTQGYANGTGSIAIAGRNFNRSNGAGIYLHYTSPMISNVEILTNTANYGAGLFNLWASPIVTNVKIAGNNAVNEGAGIYNTADSRPTITNSLIVGNSSAIGGGMRNISSSPVFTNVTISGNKGGANGAMFNSSSTITFRNSIILGNSSVGVSDAQSTVDYAHSLVQDLTSVANGNINASGLTNANLFINAPAFSTAPFTIGDFGLAAESEAINKGSNSYYEASASPDLSTIDKDLLRNTRFFDGQVDLGAIEYQILTITSTNNILYVKKGATGNGSSWTNALGEVAEALRWASVKKLKWTAESPLQIWVAGGTYLPLFAATDLSETPTDSRTKSFVLVKDVKLYGGFAGNERSLGQRDLKLVFNQSVLSGDINTANDETDNVYHVVISANEVGTAELNGFVVSAGNTTGSSGSMTVNAKSITNVNGAGMYNHTSSPKINHVSFVNNKATSGGGLFNIHSSAVITNSKFVANTANSGAGMYSSSVVTVYNALFSGNKAISAGGAIYNNASAQYFNITVAGNSASQGAAMFNAGSHTPMLTNSILLGNSSAFGGVGIVNSSYSLIQGSASIINNNLSAQGVQATDIFNTSVDATSAPTINGNYTLKVGAVVINKGNDLAIANTTDLNNDVRVKGLAVDLGAYEDQAGDTRILAQPNGEIVYVKQGGNGLGNSWAGAYNELADALVAAKQNTDIKQIWVAAGTYLPKYTPADGEGFSASPIDARDKAFLMVPQVSIYGGFTGVETDLAQRILNNEQTILSGDIGIWNNDTDNAYHVVLNAQNAGNTILDNLTITDGNANGMGTLSLSLYNFNRQNGGGLYFINEAPKVNNVLVKNNRASYGAGYFINSTNATITNSKIIGNVSADAGGAIYSIYVTSYKIINTLIVGNKALNGAAIFNNNTQDFNLINSTIAGNYATDNSVIRSNYGSTRLVNSVVLGNSHGITTMATGSFSLANSLVQGESATTNGNLDAAGITENAVFTNPVAYINAPFSTGVYTVKNTSPTINKGDKTVFNAGQTPDLSALTTDLAGSPRIFDMEVDMGAYELQEAAVLPVKLLEFTAGKQTTSALLKWQTASEQNNKTFIISRSTDGNHFEILATLKGAGTSTVSNKYQFTDFSPLSGSNYYRLQQQDLDGKLTDLGVRVLSFDLNRQTISLQPNPATTQVIVTFKAERYQSLALIDITGRVLNKVKLFANQTNVTLPIANLNAGLYLIKLKGSNGTEMLKLLKK